MNIEISNSEIRELTIDQLDIVGGGENVSVRQAFLEAMVNIGLIIPQNEVGSYVCK